VELSTAVTIILSLLALAGGIAVGVFLHKRGEQRRIGTAQSQAEKLLKAASTEAESIRRTTEIESKEILFKAKSEAEHETRDRITEIQKQQERLLKREENLERKADLLGTKESDLSRKEQDLARREKAAESSARQSVEILAKAQKKLEELASMTRDQAKELLVQQVIDEAKQIAATQIKEIEEATEKEARERSSTIVASAIQRFASEYVTERTVSVVQLPNDDMKGRIIGREGRNIRALEAATGVDLIIDDTPEAVILSCFNPVRREVAKLSLMRLIADGRIHPSRIEDVVKRCEEEVEAGCKEAGEQAVFDLGLHRVHPELIRLIGQFKYRSSYAQNLLQHSVEVGYLAGLMAAEIGQSVKQARRAGLLHDIGKAVGHEQEGSHAKVGAELARKYGEAPRVVHAIAAHHGEEPMTGVIDFLVDAANRLSAQRPGARKERLQAFVQRLSDLEAIGKSFKGVDRVFAIQAGREVRILVESESIDDKMAILLSKDIAKKVEAELTYPGQIRICVVRETRSSSMAR
jgi:ribonucrease Y